MGNLLWFFLGAGAATMYAKRQSRLEAEQGPWTRNGCHGHFNHGPTSHPPQGHPSQAPPLPSQGTPRWPTENNNVSASSPPYQDSSPAQNSSFFPSSPGAPGAGVQSDPWAAEKERMREIGNQVGVNVMELSETTLDTLLSTIEGMKERVARQRIERERAETERMRLAEEQRMNPPRFV